jgi:hypothetical protein
MKNNKTSFIDNNISKIINTNKKQSNFGINNNIQQWDRMMVIEKKKSREELEQEEQQRQEEEFYYANVERANNPTMSDYLNQMYGGSQSRQKIKIEAPVIGREIGVGVLQAQQTYDNFVAPINNTPVIIKKINPNLQDIYQKEEQKEQVVNKLITKLHSNEDIKIEKQPVQSQIENNNPFNEFKEDIIINPFEEHNNKPTFVKGPIKTKTFKY